MKTQTLFALALAPQLALLAGLVVREEHARATGTEVVLEVRAYDPMDPLSGRYIRVPLAIARIELADVKHQGPLPEQGSIVYVRLEKREKQWEPIELCAQEPDAALGPFLRARRELRWASDTTNFVQLDYELDRFYISEKANDPTGFVNGQWQAHALKVVVRVTGAGRGAITDLLVDGQPYAEWNRAQR